LLLNLPAVTPSRDTSSYRKSSCVNRSVQRNN